MAIIGAQQPYFFPNFYYFYKIVKSDFFIISDFLRFRKQSPIVRTSINKNQFLTIPVVHQNDPHPKIRDVQISAKENWKRLHLRTLESNFRKSPYFEYYFPEIVSLYQRPGIQLNQFLNSTLTWQLKLLLPDKNILYASNEGMNILDDLKSYVEKFDSSILLHYPEEKGYYQKHLSEYEREEIQLPENINFPPDYHPSLSLLVLLFLKGPETVFYLR